MKRGVRAKRAFRLMVRREAEVLADLLYRVRNTVSRISDDVNQCIYDYADHHDYAQEEACLEATLRDLVHVLKDIDEDPTYRKYERSAAWDGRQAVHAAVPAVETASAE